MCCHDIQLVESFATSRALPHAGGNSGIDAAVTEDMSTGLEDGIFKVVSTD